MGQGQKLPSLDGVHVKEDDRMSMSIELLCLVSAMGLTAWLIWLTLPAARQMVLALPNERSSHKEPVPQWGGVCILATTLPLLAAIHVWDGAYSLPWTVIGAAALLGVVGYVDDRKGLTPLFRLFVSAAAAFGVCFATGATLPVTGLWLPDALFAGAALLVLMNVTNFMDGIDGLVVVEFVPMLVYLSTLGAMGWFIKATFWPPALLAGSLLGFFVFNKPRAKVFLGDAGSITLGFLIGFILLKFTADAGLAAVVILPLYFLADAGITLTRRILRGERVWMPHRLHFYQRAFDANQGNWSILVRVLLFNVIACAASLVTVMTGAWVAPLLLCTLACSALLYSMVSYDAARS